MGPAPALFGHQSSVTTVRIAPGATYRKRVLVPFIGVRVEWSFHATWSGVVSLGSCDLSFRWAFFPEVEVPGRDAASNGADGAGDDDDGDDENENENGDEHNNLEQWGMATHGVAGRKPMYTSTAKTCSFDGDDDAADRLNGVGGGAVSPAGGTFVLAFTSEGIGFRAKELSLQVSVNMPTEAIDGEVGEAGEVAQLPASLFDKHLAKLPFQVARLPFQVAKLSQDPQSWKQNDAKSSNLEPRCL